MKRQDANVAVYVFAVQNAIKYFDIDVNGQNPDNYSKDKLDAALKVREGKHSFFHRNRDIESHDRPMQTDRGMFSSSSDKDKKKKKKPKYRPSKLLYGALAVYLWRSGHKKYAVGTVVAYFIHRHYANNGQLEKLVDGLLAKVKTNSGTRALENDGSGSEGRGVDLSQFDLDC